MVVVIQMLGTVGRGDVLARACSGSLPLLRVWGDAAEDDQSLGLGDLKHLFKSVHGGGLRDPSDGA